MSEEQSPIKVRTDIKIIVIGPVASGKTSFVNRWTIGTFEDTYKATIVSEFRYKIVTVKDHNYRIQMWDIGGQDKSTSIAKIFSRDSHGCIVLGDCTKEKKFEETLKWKNIIANESNFCDGGPLPFVLIMNKIDIIEDEEKKNYIERFCKNSVNDNKFDNYFLTSVKENKNVDEAMDYLVKLIIERLENFAKDGHSEVFRENSKRNDSVKLLRQSEVDRNEEAKKKKNECC